MEGAMPNESPPGGVFRSRSGLVLLGFLAVGGYFVWTEHQAHAIQYLPYALLLLCPLMHLFHRHGGHGGKDSNEEHVGHRHERDRR
jgi:hypothetical protein